MRALALLMCGVPLVLATVLEAANGNGVARGIVVGFVGFFGSLFLLAVRPEKPAPRRAEPTDAVAGARRAYIEGRGDLEALERALDDHFGLGPHPFPGAPVLPDEAPTTVDRSWPCVRDNRFDEDCEGPHVEADGGTRRICLRRRPTEREERALLASEARKARGIQ